MTLKPVQSCVLFYREQQKQHALSQGVLQYMGAPQRMKFFASNKIQFRGAIRHGNCFSLVSRIDQTNEHHLKLMTVCLNSVLHDLDGKALRVARVGFTFCHFRQSQRWYLDQLCLYSKTNQPIIFCLHDRFVGFIYRCREHGESVNKNIKKIKKKYTARNPFTEDPVLLQMVSIRFSHFFRINRQTLSTLYSSALN